MNKLYHNQRNSLPPARIVLISGSPGTGKTSISELLADHSGCGRAVHIHIDDFYQCIRKGYRPPWLSGSGDQNETVNKSVAASAKQFFLDGYEVFVDGVIGPWFLAPWLAMAQEGCDLRYVVLRPDKQTTVSRAAGREQRAFFPLQDEDVRDVWQSLTDLGRYEPHAVDTTALTVAESAALIQKLLHEGSFRVP